MWLTVFVFQHSNHFTLCVPAQGGCSDTLCRPEGCGGVLRASTSLLQDECRRHHQPTGGKTAVPLVQLHSSSEKHFMKCLPCCWKCWMVQVKNTCHGHCEMCVCVYIYIYKYIYIYIYICVCLYVVVVDRFYIVLFPLSSRLTVLLSHVSLNEWINFL